MIAKLWIRVNARLADDAEVRAFARRLLPDAPAWLAVEAGVGLLVTLWGRVIDEQEDGNISQRDDDVLEEWAKWRGEAGRFATMFREAFAPDGRIKLWQEYQGSLIARREKDRERKRQSVGRVPDASVAAQPTSIPRAIPQEGHAEFQRSSDRNGDGDGNGESSSPPPARRAFDPIATLLAEIPVKSRPAWEAAIRAAEQGMQGPVMTREQIESACLEFVGNGGCADTPNLRHFRGYLGRAARGEPVRRDDGEATRMFAAIRKLETQRANPGRGVIRLIPRADVEKLGRAALEAYDAVGGAERFLAATGDTLGYLQRDFEKAYRSVTPQHAGAA